MSNYYKPTHLAIEKKYPKLIRDRIPELFRASKRKNAKTRVAKKDSEFLEFLLKKIVEESSELQYSIKHGNLIEELADVFEIFEQILKLEKLKMKDIKAFQKKKRKRNGGFTKRLLLLSD